MNNAVIFYNWFGGINGSLINCFEYYIALKEYGIPIKLLLLNCSEKTKNIFIDVFENRYILNDLNWKDDIECMYKHFSIIKNEFDNVLVIDYSTINKTKGILKSNKIIVISELYTDKPEYMYDKKLQNVIYYGEMPFVYKDHQYKMKMLFHRFKPLLKVDKALYVNSPNSKDYSFIDKLGIFSDNIIYKSPNHLYNIFERFDTYLYYHANKWFDPHPKLFHECYYYNKKIIYINEHGVLDGSYFRYTDLKKNGLKNRFFTKDDEIIREFND